MAESNKKDVRFTLLVLGGKAGPPRRIEVTGRLITTLVTVTAVLAVVLSVVLVDYVRGKFGVAVLQQENLSLRSQNARMLERTREKDRQLADLSDSMRSMELTLEKIEEVEGSVRVLTGITGGDRKLINKGAVVTPRLGGNIAQSDVAQLYNSASELMERMELQNVTLAKVARYFNEQRSEILQIPSAWPVKGWVTSLFGVRSDPFTGQPTMHDGMDIAAPEGTVVRAPAAGMVIFAGEQPGYGNAVVLRHGRGINTFYGHLVKSLVNEGQRVPSGTPIALVGNTGRSTGPHLHYEVRLNGIPVNPQRFLPEEVKDGAKPAYLTVPVPQSPMTVSPPTIDEAPNWPSEPVSPDKDNDGLVTILPQ